MGACYCQENDPVPAEQLLIVTFTNAAAAELRRGPKS